MQWLTYSDDEVERFHLEFLSAADEALHISHLDANLEWKHHVRSLGNPLIPDFVLRKKVGNSWLLALEVKRRKEAVHSTRNQIQAKSYAETNQDRYAPGAPRYFAISNLETTILFALNQGHPPLECRLENGIFESGEFVNRNKNEHRQEFVQQMLKVLEIVTTGAQPRFDEVWPGIIADLLSYSAILPPLPSISILEPVSPEWSLVRDYFCSPTPNDSSRLFILRCLICEYLRGLLLRYEHPGAASLPPIGLAHPATSVATAIDCIRKIDFQAMFAEHDSLVYRELNDKRATEVLAHYVSRIMAPSNRIVDLAIQRVDSAELLESLMAAMYPVKTQDECGKVTTDPELAAILATLTVLSASKPVLDPCCGDGALLSAAYDRLRALGLDHAGALAAIVGVEADPIAVRLASVRLALKEPKTVSPEPPIAIVQGDMFAQGSTVAGAGAILVNPPFKRYEAQDLRPIPPELRQHYAKAIQDLDGQPPTTTGGQANLYTYYVEFLGKAAQAGARIGVILDNKWYHNQYGRQLRQFLLDNFQLEALIEYPHYAFFTSWTIATSILIAQKTTPINPNHKVRFIRCRVDPRGVDLGMLLAAYEQKGDWPSDWTCRLVPQGELKAEVGWKSYFLEPLTQDYRRSDWPILDQLFEWGRRGSLQKEEGGIGVLEFPFRRPNYGPKRKLKEPPRRPFQTESAEPLTPEQNQLLADLAEAIPSTFRGWAVRNSDILKHYELDVSDVSVVETLEPPLLRSKAELFHTHRRTPWTTDHEAAINELMCDPAARAFLDAIRSIVNLDESVLPKEELWNVLREPIAGELIIPRKMRSGHRVHVNPFPLNPAGRQVRTSSNFITYSQCTASDSGSGLDQLTAVRLIAAFLVSSFGQLQFESEGYNREGLLAVEKANLSRIRIFDPRWIRPESRQAILDAFAQLPYPIATDRLSASQPERDKLDLLIAQEIASRFPEFDARALIDETHAALDEWLTARQP